MPKCVVSGCLSRSDKGFLLKRFPSEKKDKARHDEWVKRVGRENWQPSVDSRLCELHFDDNAWMVVDGVTTRELKGEAVPTVFSAPSRPPRKRSVWKKLVTAVPVSPPSPPKGSLKHIKLLHAYAKSPSRLPLEEECSEDFDDFGLSCHPLSKKDLTSCLIRVRDFSSYLAANKTSSSPDDHTSVYSPSAHTNKRPSDFAAFEITSSAPSPSVAGNGKPSLSVAEGSSTV